MILFKISLQILKIFKVHFLGLHTLYPLLFYVRFTFGKALAENKGHSHRILHRCSVSKMASFHNGFQSLGIKSPGARLELLMCQPICAWPGSARQIKQYIWEICRNGVVRLKRNFLSSDDKFS